MSKVNAEKLRAKAVEYLRSGKAQSNGFEAVVEAAVGIAIMEVFKSLEEDVIDE